MNTTEKIATIQGILDNMTTDEQVWVHNEYCDEANYPDFHIYGMYDLDEILSGRTPTEIARMTFYGIFCPAHEYFWFNGYGNLESSDFPARQGQIDLYELAANAVEKDLDYGCDDIREILDMEEPDEE